jgi:hypothetical protein
MATDKKDDIQPKIVLNTDAYFGMVFYIKTDPAQEEYRLTKLKLEPGVTNKKGEQIPAVKFLLSNGERVVWLYDFECSIAPDELKQLRNRENGENNDDDD